MKFISLLIFFTLLNTSYSIIPYPSHCPNGHYCPTIKYGAISENSQPKSPGWTLSFIGISTIGEAMSVYPDVDTYKGQFSVTGDGSAPMSVDIKLGCTNKLIGELYFSDIALMKGKKITVSPIPILFWIANIFIFNL